MALSRVFVVVTLLSSASAAEDHIAQSDRRSAGSSLSSSSSSSPRRPEASLEGFSEPDPGSLQRTTNQHRPVVERLEQPIRDQDLKLLTLPIHDQSVRSVSKADGQQTPTPTPVVCPPSTCPEVALCPGIPSSRGDPSVGACWNPDIADEPSAAERKVLRHIDPLDLNYSGLDICLENVTGASGDLVRPGCPWSGDKWGGRKVQPEGAGRLRDGWAGQVFVLEDVYLDAFGRVFNSTHRFDVGGCPVPHQLAYGNGTKVLEIEEAVNLLASPSEALPDPLAPRKTPVFHAMLYELPLLLPVLRMLPRIHRLVLATTNTKFHRTVSTYLTRAFPWDAKLHSISAPSPGTLWLVRRLFQPVFQSCAQPSPGLWKQMRQEYLLPQQILETAQQLSEEQPLVPPFTPAIPTDWVVVVHRKALAVRVNGTSVQALLEQFFPPQRVVVFHRGFDADDWELFNKAALLITVHHSSIANVMFMPPHAAVLQLRGPPARLGTPLEPPVHSPTPDSDPDSDLGVSLAEACDLRTYIGFCGQGMEQGMEQGKEQGTWLCEPFPILDVIDRVSHHAYTAIGPPHLRRNSTSPSPGMGIVESWFSKSAAAVRDVEQWAACVGDRGGWVYNPKPRILAWEYTGFSNMCDHRHVGKGGLATTKADAVAAAGGSPKDWTVRETLKYEWVVPQGECPPNELAPQKATYPEFSAKEFCSRVGKGRTFLFLGDSLTDQFMTVFLNNMLKHIPKPATWAVSEEIPRECYDWLPPQLWQVHHMFCRDVRFHDDVCPGLRVILVRNDYLILGGERSFGTMAFTRFSFLKDADVVVANRGAHYVPTEKFTRDMTAFFHYMRNRFPEMLLVYRNSPPGHDHCEGATGPIKSRQDPASLPYNWGEFQNQNKVARELVRRHDYVYMDVDTMTALRPDGHKGFRGPPRNTWDCLHYCTPGPQDQWVQHFFNTMLWVDPLEPSRRLQN